MTHENKELHIRRLAWCIQIGADGYVTDNFRIECPTSQMTGTSTQQRTYANMKARELIEAL